MYVYITYGCCLGAGPRGIQFVGANKVWVLTKCVFVYIFSCAAVHGFCVSIFILYMCIYTFFVCCGSGFLCKYVHICICVYGLGW